MNTVTADATRETFANLAREHLPRLYSMASRLAGPPDAEDVVQDCLLKAYRSFDALQDRQAAPAWLSRILVNCCRDRDRAGARAPQEVSLDDEEFSLYRKIADEDPFPYSDSLHLDFLQLFGTEDVHKVLATLPDMYRYPLVLVHMEGFSTQEVADLVAAPRGTVLARLHRGRKLFERHLWEYAESNGLLKEVP